MEERAQRLGEQAETPMELREREKSDASRYQDYYGIDITDLSIYDLVVDTGTLSEEGDVSNGQSGDQRRPELKGNYGRLRWFAR